MRSAERRKVNVLEMKCSKILVGVSRMDRVGNEEVCRNEEVRSSADQRVLIRFGYVERMDEYRMARRVFTAEVSIGRVRGRPRLGWMDGVKVALGNRGMTVEAVRPCFLSDRAPMLWSLSPGDGWVNCEKGATTENQGTDVKFMG